MKKIILFVLTFLAACLFATIIVSAQCTSVMVAKDASVDGSVMTTHTCDGWYDQRVRIIPGQKFEPGAEAEVMKVDVYKELCHITRPGVEPIKAGEIPQVPETYTYFHIGYPFMNEKQVIIGEATWSGERALRNSQGIFMIEELEAFGLQRAATARECIQIMGELAEKYGYGDGGEGLTVTDPNEVWLFEIAGPGPLWSPGSDRPGAVWAAQRVPDGHVSVIANRSRIGEIDLDDPDHFMASENVMSLAEELDLWNPDDGPFSFWKAYNPEPYGSRYYQQRREWRALSLLAPSLNLDPYQEEQYPFSVKKKKKVSVRDLMAIKRDHYEGTEFDLTAGMAAGPFGNPNRYPTPGDVKPEDKKNLDWERAISIFRCSYSFVSQARSWLPDPIGGVLWFGEDAPHSTCYVPIYAGATSVPESFSSGRRDVYDKDAAWWAFNFVSNWADLKYSYMIQDIQAAQQKVEGDFFAMQPAVELAGVQLYEQDPELAVKYITNYTHNCANRAVKRWWELADELVAKYDDGYVGDLDSVGYPTWWLEEVGFGDGYLKE